jgi:uncharacterized protein (TIGR03435 family)
VHSIPYTVVIGRSGTVLAITRPDKLTADLLEKALASQPLDLAPLEGVPSDLEWDRLIDWQDGVVPSAYVIIKPVKTFTSGSVSRPDHIVGDGVYLSNLLQIAFQTDYYHLDWKLPESYSKNTYRFAARVPKDQPDKLLPLLRQTITAFFGIKADWETQSREVLLLRRIQGLPEIVPSTAQQPVFQMLRGKISLKKQRIGSLVGLLTNLARKPVVDESGLMGEYDFDLAYQPDDMKVIEAELAKLGLELIAAKRDLKVLVVSKG